MSYRRDDRRDGGYDRRDDRRDGYGGGGGYGRSDGPRRDERRDSGGGYERRDDRPRGGGDRGGYGGNGGGYGGRRDDERRGGYGGGGGYGGRGGGGGGRGGGRDGQSERNIFADKSGDPRRRTARERRENSSDEDEAPLPLYQRRRESLWDRMEAPEQIEVELQQGSAVIKRQQKRLYFGNIPSHVNENDLMEFVNSTMISSGTVTKPGNPATSVTINREKSFAFVEFRTEEESNIGMGLDGVTIQGQILRVRRPKDWSEGLESDPTFKKSSINVNSIISASAGESPHKIYIGNIPASLGEGDVKKLLSMFGTLRQFNMVRDSLTGLSKGFAFAEFADITVTDAACKALHQMVIGDKTLVCQRASIHMASKVGEENTVLVDPRAAAMLTLSAPTASLLASAVKEEKVEPTRILVLLNIMNMTDFPGDKVHEEYDETYSDMVDFFSQFGKVNSVLIPRPLKKIVHDTVEHFDFKTYFEDEEELENENSEDEAFKIPGFGKVYVEFQRVEDSGRAAEAMVGLRFDGRMCITTYLSEEKWNAGDLEPDLLKEEEKVRMIKPDLSKYA